jgi:hypothetical protein
MAGLAALLVVAAWSWSVGTTVFWMSFWRETGIGERGLRLAVATSSGDGSSIKRDSGRVEGHQALGSVGPRGMESVIISAFSSQATRRQVTSNVV